MKIEKIYSTPKRNGIEYRGTLRNERKFNMFDNVFVAMANKIIVAQVVGIESTVSDNPEFIYKLRLPEDILEKNTIELDCKRIFNTIDEAKESAIKQLENMTKIWYDDINSFFEQFNQLNP